ncbi:TonB-dependent receptor [Massilia forsythiae]|uniref:TonB-dependent receptor n=1 Tax=Massilia forsythiae TaxID=2728020 RepID=A0A7Z2W1I5_9BURK|nr:TonB-dependent receptor [Massilia forsythiae]QJE03014.1 TonB-dependent receptor [Massilia forsythiae]
MTKQFAVKRSVLAVALTLASPALVFAQAEQPVQKVYVTGSNIKRADKEDSSPISVLNAKEIAATGANTVAELLHNIPAFGSGTSNDIQNDNGFSKGVSTASLRGLGTSSTLVLLNGRRIAASAYADPNNGKSSVYDLNNIPVSAIARVEVFKDGASAVYGSDAIAGVVNFITKDDYQGAEISASTSANDDNEFKRNSVSGIIGFGDLEKDRYNGFISIDLAKRGHTGIKDVKDIEQGPLSAINYRLSDYGSYASGNPFVFRELNAGRANFSTSAANGQYVRNSTAGCQGNVITGGPQYGIGLTTSSMLTGRQFCNFDIWNYYEAQSKGTDINLLSKFTAKLGDNVTSFTELGFSRIEREYVGLPKTLSSTSATTVFRVGGLPTTYQLLLPSGHPDNPFPGYRAAPVLRMVNSDGGAENTNKSYRFLTGLRGTAGAFDWETGFLYNRTERDDLGHGYLYRPVIDLIASQNRTLAATIADPNAVRDVDNTGYSQVMQLDAKASTTVGKLAGGDIGLAFGGEVRQEKIGLTSDPELAAGNIIGLSNSVLDGRRVVKSAFVELRTPFTKTFEMDFAGRYDKYPNAKSFVPKVGAKWEATDKITFRGTYAEGFRAPALSQVSPGGVQSFNNGFVDPIRCPDGRNPVSGADSLDCSRSVSSISTPNANLKNETSKSYSFGTIINPTRNLDILIDYYKIRKENETALLSASYVAQHPELYPGLAIRDSNNLVGTNGAVIPNSGQLLAINRTFVNQGSTETSGIDFEVAHRLNLGEMGRLSTRLNYTYALTYKRAERPGEVEHNLVGTNGGISDWATSVGDIPRHRFNLISTWSRDVHTVSLSADYVSSVSLLRRYDNTRTYPVPFCYYGNPANTPSDVTKGGLPGYLGVSPNCEVDEWLTFGAAYSYTGFKNWTLSANIKNLFDTKAPYDPRETNLGFNSQLHNGMGRYFRLSASYKFK